MAPGSKSNPNGQPWYRRTFRWGQTNITEIDPARYDISWWRKYWKRTRTQGVIINAGGIVAYYPSKVPFHKPAQFLGGRDLFGELCRAAHDDGLVVFARMDSNRAHEELYAAHPDWFAVDAEGKPYKAGELFVTCVSGPYYAEHIPAVLREIIERYHPEGFTDNSWSGLGQASICHCQNCQKDFRERTGLSLPREKNWNDEAYRKWIEWSYARRLEIWDLNNRVTRATGGPDCIWAGMNSGSISGQCQSFRDYRQICRRAEIIMLDHQARSDLGSFQQNGDTGKLIHGLLGWDKLLPESMAMYQAGRPTFRLSSKPAPEARLWMLDGIAGGIQPWWHHVGAYHEDRRMYHTAEPICRWHEQNQHYLVNRRPIASVGVVWSQQNMDFYGRDDAETLVELPWRGLVQALVRARIPYLPVHADDLDRDSSRFAVLLLPNLAAMSDSQLAAVRRHVGAGGGLLATGQTSLFNGWGDPRPDFALGDLFGAHVEGTPRALQETTRAKWAKDTIHSYLRLLPELRAGVDGPRSGTEPPITGKRHPVLRGFEETDILPFGGVLEALRVDDPAQVVMTFVPEFPIYPPETAWMRQPKTEIPGLLLRTLPQAGRVAFLPADLDRRFARDNLPDHGDLLANLIRWIAKDDIPLSVEGRGLIDCHLYSQPGRLVIHLVNLTSAGTWRQPVHELIPIGPLDVCVKLPEDVRGKSLRLLVSGAKASVSTAKGWARFEIRNILDHEVAVLA
ncbi:MAG TPA: alpha-amylase family protein [Verrucomicrobiae bacterium]